MAHNVATKTEAEMKINLSALKNHDPEIDQIIDTASSVAHYKFLSTTGVWDKTEVEGTLFLYSRHSSPVIVIFIMNRLNKENTKLVLTPDMEFKIQKPFLLCKSASSEIIGIWFYDPDECQRFGTLLGRLAVLAKDERSLKIAAMMECQKKIVNDDVSTVRNNKSGKNVILDMLNNAQTDFNKNKGNNKKNTPNRNKAQNNKVKKRSDPNNEKVVPRKSPPANKNTYKETAKQQKETFKKNHIKEQEMLLSILHGGETRKHNRTRTVSSSTELENENAVMNQEFSSQAGDLAIFNKLGIITETNQVVKQKAIGCAQLESELLHRNKSENNLKRSISHNNATLQKVKSSPNICQIQNESIIPASSSNSSTTSGQPVLLSPSVLKCKSGKGRGTVLNSLMNNQQKVSLAANFNVSSKFTPKKLFSEEAKGEGKYPEAPSSAAANALMSPAAFQLSASTTKQNQEAALSEDFILSKDQFQDALIYLIKNNETFVTALHEAYLETSCKK